MIHMIVNFVDLDDFTKMEILVKSFEKSFKIFRDLELQRF